MTVPMVGVLDGHRADTRTNDPETSHAARDSISNEALAESQAEVLAILRIYGPQANHDIETLHEGRYAAGQTSINLSGSRLRTARAELEKDGRLVLVTAKGAITPSGRRADVWGVAL